MQVDVVKRYCSWTPFLTKCSKCYTNQLQTLKSCDQDKLLKPGFWAVKLWVWTFFNTLAPKSGWTSGQTHMNQSFSCMCELHLTVCVKDLQLYLMNDSFLLPLFQVNLFFSNVDIIIFSNSFKCLVHLLKFSLLSF